MRPPRNPSEKAFWQAARAAGWQPEKRGWPDFICFRDKEFIVVEVKPSRGHALKREQTRTLAALASAGIRAYRWSPEGGFVRIQLAE